MFVLCFSAASVLTGMHLRTNFCRRYVAYKHPTCNLFCNYLHLSNAYFSFDKYFGPQTKYHFRMRVSGKVDNVDRPKIVQFLCLILGRTFLFLEESQTSIVSSEF